MVLKIASDGTANYFSGSHVQVSLVNKVDSDGCKTPGLPWDWRSINEDLPMSRVAHVTNLGAERSWSLMFDSEAFLMENGKTIDQFPAVSEII